MSCCIFSPSPVMEVGVADQHELGDDRHDARELAVDVAERHLAQVIWPALLNAYPTETLLDRGDPHRQDGRREIPEQRPSTVQDASTTIDES